MRHSPEKLPRKLLALREKLKVTQERMAELLAVDDVTAARVGEYETGEREPDLIVVLRYARVAGVPMEALVDDQLRVPRPLNSPTK